MDFPGNSDVNIIAAYHTSSFPSFTVDNIIGPISIATPSSSVNGGTSTINNTGTRTLQVTKVGNINLADASSTAELFRQHGPPDIVIHLAAISNLMECQLKPDTAMAVNCPTETLLLQLPSHCKIIFLSTDQIYNGVNAPYNEDDEREESPVNTYGETKLAFERALLLSSNTQQRSVICLRSSLILGPKTPWECRKQSFLQFAQEALLAKHKKTDIFTDEYRSVIYVQDVIRIILWFAFTSSNDGRNFTGRYNMGGPERVSRWDIVKEMAHSYNLDDWSHIIPIERSSLPASDVKSPADITMNIAKLCSVTGLQMTPLKEIIKLSLI